MIEEVHNLLKIAKTERAQFLRTNHGKRFSAACVSIHTITGVRENPIGQDEEEEDSDGPVRRPHHL